MESMVLKDLLYSRFIPPEQGSLPSHVTTCPLRRPGLLSSLMRAPVSVLSFTSWDTQHKSGKLVRSSVALKTFETGKTWICIRYLPVSLREETWRTIRSKWMIWRSQKNLYPPKDRPVVSAARIQTSSSVGSSRVLFVKQKESMEWYPSAWSDVATASLRLSTLNVTNRTQLQH